MLFCKLYYKYFHVSEINAHNKFSGLEGEALAAGTANATRRFINETQNTFRFILTSISLIKS